jgi:hypothetical protein
MLYCPRRKCKHNHGGVCGFFSGFTFYFAECLDTGSMYEPREEEESEEK